MGPCLSSLTHLSASSPWHGHHRLWPLQSLPIHIRRPVPATLVRVRERRQHRLLLALPSMRAASVDTGYSASSDDPAAELANRVRKNAGLVLAVQIGSDPQYHLPTFTTPPPPLYPTTNITASAFIAPPIPVMQSRPKTSHTTIERRYRTNLNVCIQLLRQAVPALRVVDRAAAIKVGGDASDPEDHIDVHGFVDGVKIVRKCSKANVLGETLHPSVAVKSKSNTKELDEVYTPIYPTSTTKQLRMLCCVCSGQWVRCIDPQSQFE
ncbi:hypothetical protein B0H16DRAFT_1792957 [Mycena metata]|uniref:BHLH domain-containing protein n=1 Tax=Mycena metata TaxID=1033252 RepID=A0AAD7JLY0_9AGAR|nr:hypothetical protein B0H16DRAFT_1792957 [Mycena metata]